MDQVRGIGGAGLRAQDLRRLREGWRIMIGMEADVLREFDLRHEADCQQQGAVLLEAQALRGRALAQLANVRVRVPEVLTDYCGPGVLTMEFASGRSLREVLESAGG